ncbi:MAG TPA: FkbM family methyltransferase [Nitrososphaeraceae archaeon]|jgi:FkbM family methyltransferase|nr:FkbM family methyltransferase [Nitrososphaeraceae archaeon]
MLNKTFIRFRAKASRIINNPRDPVKDMARLLKPHQVKGIIDAGAYHGEMSRRFKTAFPFASIYAFEPYPETFALLEENVHDLSNVRIFNLAISSHTGTSNFYINFRSYTNSLLPRSKWGEIYHFEQTTPVGSCEVRLVTLDDWREQFDIEDGIDIVKLDIQGGELEALRGAPDLLSSTVKLVYSEIQFVPLYEGACLYFELASFLEKIDFHLYQFYDLKSAPDGRLIYGDALFARSYVL